MPVPGDSLHVFEVVPSELLHLSAADVSLSRKLHEKPQLVREQLSLKHTVWKLNQMLTETERQTDRQAGRQAGGQRQTQRRTNRQTDSVETESNVDSETERQTDRQIDSLKLTVWKLRTKC